MCFGDLVKSMWLKLFLMSDFMKFIYENDSHE